MTPIEVARLHKLLYDAEKYLIELSDDLSAEIYATYHDFDGNIHPANLRRYERDMSIIKEAKVTILEIKQYKKGNQFDIERN